MADTNFIKHDIEPIIRNKLEKKFGQKFSKQCIKVGKKLNGESKLHEFDAVSEDKSIIVAIKSNTGKTQSGKMPHGKIASAFREMYFLSLAKAKQKYLVLTDPEFYKIIYKEFDGILPPKVKLLHIPIPENEQNRLYSLKGRSD